MSSFVVCSKFAHFNIYYKQAAMRVDCLLVGHKSHTKIKFKVSAYNFILWKLLYICQSNVSAYNFVLWKLLYLCRSKLIVYCCLVVEILLYKVIVCNYMYVDRTYLCIWIQRHCYSVVFYGNCLTYCHWKILHWYIQVHCLQFCFFGNCFTFVGVDLT